MTGKPNWATIKRLIDEFGAEFAINLKPYDKRPPKRVVLDCMKVNAKLAAYGDEREEQIEAYDFTDDPSAVRVVCLWDRFYPARSNARQIMSRALSRGGVLRDQVAHVWAVPRVLPGPPLAEQIAPYRMHALSAVDAANVEHVVLIGSGAVKLWRQDLQVSKVAGGTYVWQNRWLIHPIMNPTSVLADRTLEDAWKHGMGRVLLALNEEHTRLGVACVECGRGMDVYDEHAVPWCREHFNPNGVMNVTKGWNKKMNETGQGELL